MKMTTKEALVLLEEVRKKVENDGWIRHSICVGNAASKIAKALNQKGFNLDIKKAKTLGYIHDIGKMIDGPENHVINGYEYMKSKGYDDEYCNICMTHSYLNNDVFCTAGMPTNIPFRTNFIKNHKYTLYEKIINLCDLMCTTKVITIEKRLIDLLIRKGLNKNSQYHIIETCKLKQYFDDLLGYNLYNIFPEIKRNL